MSHLFLVTFTTHVAEGVRSTIPAILLGAVLGVALAGLLGWGLAALLGKRLLIRWGLVLLAGLFGLIGAVIGDAKAAYKRPLNMKEQHIADRVFGESLDVSKVQLAFGCRLMNWPKRSMNRTPGNTIFLSHNYSEIGDNIVNLRYEDMLVHELTHVWQTQNGISLFKKVWTSLGVVFHKTKPYDYGGKAGLNEKRLQKWHFRQFGTEQQAALLAHYYCCKYHDVKGTNDCKEMEHFALQVLLNDGYHMEQDTLRHQE